jgi:hypothetical protein
MLAVKKLVGAVAIACDEGRQSYPYVFSGDQREDMCLLKYQALPSLRDVAHDGVLCTFSPRLAKVVWSVRVCGIHRPSRTR